MGIKEEVYYEGLEGHHWVTFHEMIILQVSVLATQSSTPSVISPYFFRCPMGHFLAGCLY